MIGLQGVQHLANALEYNKTLTILNLNSNLIDSQGAQHLANALEHNNILTILDLHYNQIGDQGAKCLANALQHNNILTKLNLISNGISSQGAQYLASALEHNNTLTTLKLDSNEIDDQGAQHLANALEHNNVTQSPSYCFSESIVHSLFFTDTHHIEPILKQNRRSRSQKQLVDALQHNNTLTTLNLNSNQICNKAAQHLINVLRQNNLTQTFTRLNLNSNGIDPHVVEDVTNTSQHNSTVTTDLTSNVTESNKLTINRSKSDGIIENNDKKSIKLSPYIMFYRKLYEYVLSRLDIICSRLYGSESNKFEKIVWNLFIYLFENYTELLFRSRDLDQIILSSIYYVANSHLLQNQFYTLNEKELTWYRLIQAYKSMPNSKLKTVRSVFIRSINKDDFIENEENIDKNPCLTPSKPAETKNLIDGNIIGDITSTNNTARTTRIRTEDGNFLTTISTLSKINNSNENQDNILFNRNEKNLFFGQSTNNSIKRTHSDDSNSNCLTSLTKKVLQIEKDRQKIEEY
ncbi:unnamed protein product [Rotaria sordida]|uniref:Retinoblastoma-associated protein B-box domain-containing protein n=1 Tax=Rotaria sordida TaxID=392033 RepID=A0A815HG51_9BILA|nr:unnamed protein product [Rotaria sordida]